MPRPTYLLATRSSGKLRELRPLFASASLQIIDLTEAGIPESPDEAHIESFNTFPENARAKSEYFFHLTGYPTFADDSGLSVDALNGAPGVHSKRWSANPTLNGLALDAANNQKLITTLATTPTPITAQYTCAAAYTSPTGTHIELAHTPGHILLTPVGEHGFGYDPYFFSTELNKTFAQATLEEKATVSHRARAFLSLFHHMMERHTSDILKTN